MNLMQLDPVPAICCDHLAFLLDSDFLALHCSQYAETSDSEELKYSNMSEYFPECHSFWCWPRPWNIHCSSPRRSRFTQRLLMTLRLCSALDENLPLRIKNDQDEVNHSRPLFHQRWTVDDLIWRLSTKPLWIANYPQKPQKYSLFI